MGEDKPDTPIDKAKKIWNSATPGGKAAMGCGVGGCGFVFVIVILTVVGSVVFSGSGLEELLKRLSRIETYEDFKEFDKAYNKYSRDGRGMVRDMKNPLMSRVGNNEIMAMAALRLIHVGKDVPGEISSAVSPTTSHQGYYFVSSVFAVPASYQGTGVNTYYVSPDGKLYAKDIDYASMTGKMVIVIPKNPLAEQWADANQYWLQKLEK